MNGPAITPEVDEELDGLIDLCREVAAAEQSPWEPRCVSNAFASHSPRTFTLTMQAWIDLDAIRSPLLQDAVPATEADFWAALSAFGAAEKKGSELTPAEAAVLTEEMRAAVSAAFSMMLGMKRPDATEGDDADGFGSWLPIFACLKTQCGYTHAEALALDAGQAFAVIAAMRKNQGWEPHGTPYAVRDLEEKGERADG